MQYNKLAIEGALRTFIIVYVVYWSIPQTDVNV